MHAFLITGNSTEYLVQSIDKIAKENRAKQIPFTLQKIDDAKELKKLVKFSFSEKTAIVINDIDQATTETANAFLKNLEEPTKNIIYILTTKNLSGVLPTIISRCEVVRVQGIGYRVQAEKQNYKDALDIKDRDEAIKFIEDLLITDHQNKVFENMENYLKTIRSLKLNGNVSLQLANLVVTMNRNGR
jgi:DNA polymerase-3 subunit delta'